MTRRIPDTVYLSTDRQWAKNPTPICTEEYCRINSRDLSVDLIDDLRAALDKGLGITLNPLDVKELLHKPPRIEALEEALGKALTWESRLNRADQLARQGTPGRHESLAIQGTVHDERGEAEALLSATEEPDHA